MKWIISNLKMNLTLPQVIEYEKKLSEIKTEHKLVICPSYPYLFNFKNSNYELGSQNVSSIEGGSLTGEVSAEQLKSLGVKYTIVGHYERRKQLNETRNEIHDKINLLQKNNIVPILCIGEEDSLEKKEMDLIKEDLTKILKNITFNQDIIIAYEPTSSIGTGITPTNTKIKQIVTEIKRFIKECYNKEVKVIYGGSVNLENIKILKEIEELDGFLIGGTSLNISNLQEIVKELEALI